jgi:hypothetical protein
MSEEKKKVERVSPYVKELVKLTGKKESEIEKLWSKAKDITVETYGVQERDFKDKHYKFMMDTVKNMLGFNENRSLVVEFVQSEKGAKEFIQETMIANDFSALWKGHIAPEEKDETEMDVGDEIDKATKPTTEAKKDGTAPDGTGPHGRGAGPGKGKADGTGMKKVKDDEEEEDEVEKEMEEDLKELKSNSKTTDLAKEAAEAQKNKESASNEEIAESIAKAEELKFEKYSIEQLKEMPINDVYDTENGTIMEVQLPNGQTRFVKSETREKAKEEGWNI